MRENRLLAIVLGVMATLAVMATPQKSRIVRGFGNGCITSVAIDRSGEELLFELRPEVTILSSKDKPIYRGPHPDNFANYPVGSSMQVHLNDGQDKSFEVPMQSGHYPEMRRHDDRHYVRGPMGLDQPTNMKFILDMPLSNWRSHQPVPTPLYLAVTGGGTPAAPAPQTNADEAAAEELVLHANH